LQGIDVKPDVAGEVKPVVNVTRENARDNTRFFTPEMPDVRETKRDI